MERERETEPRRHRKCVDFLLKALLGFLLTFFGIALRAIGAGRLCATASASASASATFVRAVEARTKVKTDLDEALAASWQLYQKRPAALAVQLGELTKITLGP